MYTQTHCFRHAEDLNLNISYICICAQVIKVLKHNVSCLDLIKNYMQI